MIKDLEGECALLGRDIGRMKWWDGSESLRAFRAHTGEFQVVLHLCKA